MSVSRVRQLAYKSASSHIKSCPRLYARPVTQWRSHSNYNHFVGRTKLASTDPNADFLPFMCKEVKPFTLAIKDNIATSDFPTQCASTILSSHSSPFEATVVRQLRKRGATVVGKTNMDEFGMGSHSTNSVNGAVRNPLAKNDEVSAGGSSGGSAVAVRLGDADIALGTDTGGSIRLPAAYTGIVGYKPSYGMISRMSSRYTTSSSRLACTTNMTLGIQHHYLPHLENDVLQQYHPLEYNIDELDPSIRAAWVSAASALEAQGATLVPISLPSTKEALCAYYVLAPAEASSNLAKYDGVRYGKRGEGSDAVGETLYSDTRGEGFGEEVKRRILLGTYSLSSEAIDNYFIQAQKVRRMVQKDFDRVFRLDNPLYEPAQFDLSDMAEATGMEDKTGPVQVDFILSPTAPTFPPRLEDLKQQSSVDVYMNDVFTVPASLAGLPAVSVPAKVEGSQFPAGLQVIGQYWDDQRVLQLAEKLKSLAA
ncbi:Glutamyl-tRNA(Gln) amidotransferase subunit A [Fusarium oxysporum f. sp. cubense race 1]|uniref:Glutamyl-tRNA(Gln) amidotransferase subunit A, mitochondrial n=1 Tax=Fusarium oxysporum f. sp. cubense (strain race 1) TaxID=1229664 RepID=N4TQ60_FUSC1|nr:Glutamyl-tRNA(Gln) amidotransferase subunit A [Fusarium oxysporum f. sp. cubense race 1]